VNKVFINSIPRSGTHLAMRIISLLPGLKRGVACPGKYPYLSINHSKEELRQTLNAINSGGYLCGHVMYSPQIYNELNEFRVKTIQVIRDPRDVIVSTAFFIEKYTQHLHHDHFIKIPFLTSRLELLINGSDPGELFPRIPSIDEYYKGMKPWTSEGNALVIRFENLVGPKGGGSFEKQRGEIEKIINNLGIELESEEISKICLMAYDTSHTSFRNGQVGNWKEYFTKSLSKKFNDVAGDILQEWGYI